MSTRRESWYRCTFESKGHHVTGAVRAWSAQAAAEQFEAAMRDEAEEPGTIRVERGLGDPGVSRSARPSRLAPCSPWVEG